VIDESFGEGFEYGRIAGRIGRPNVVDWVDDAAAEEVAQKRLTVTWRRRGWSLRSPIRRGPGVVLEFEWIRRRGER